MLIILNACTSCRERRNNTLSRKCAPRTRFSAAGEQGPEAEEASWADARAPRAPIEFRGCVRGARDGCLRLARLGEGRLPVFGSQYMLVGLLLGDKECKLT